MWQLAFFGSESRIPFSSQDWGGQKNASYFFPPARLWDFPKAVPKAFAIKATIPLSRSPSSSSSVFEQRKREKKDFLPTIRLPIPILCQPLSSPIISAHRIAKGAAQGKKCDVWGREGCAFFRAPFLQALLLLQEKGVSNLFCHLVLPHSSVLWMT